MGASSIPGFLTRQICIPSIISAPVFHPDICQKALWLQSLMFRHPNSFLQAALLTLRVSAQSFLWWFYFVLWFDCLFIDCRNPKTQLQYLPPKIKIEGNGIKRGLTAVEAAVLMEQPMDKVLR